MKPTGVHTLPQGKVDFPLLELHKGHTHWKGTPHTHTPLDTKGHATRTTHVAEWPAYLVAVCAVSPHNTQYSCVTAVARLPLPSWVTPHIVHREPDNARATNA